MKIPSLLIISLSLSTLVCGKNAGRSERKKSSMKSCDQGFWKRTDNAIERSCYKQSQRHHYKKESRMERIKGREYLHLTSFSINNEQYQLFTDSKTVIMTKWSEDNERLHEEQQLNITSAYSAEVIFHDGNAILLVAVYNIGRGCGLCNRHDNRNPSRAFLWDHSLKKFEKDHFQNLPSTTLIHSFSDRYRNRSTVITVFAKCDCSTTIHYLDINGSSIEFKKIDQDNSLSFTGVMVVQSVRYQGSQYILFAPLNRHTEREPISIFNWTQSTGSLTFHRNLSTYINEDTGLSTTVFKNDVFLCSVSNASLKVTIYWLKPDQGHLEEIRHIQGEAEFSMCRFLYQDYELYAAVGYQRRVELLQYNTIARNFTDAVNLPGAKNTIDVISVQSRDDAYIVTTGDCSSKKRNCSSKKRNCSSKKRYCSNKVYRKIHS